jgi:hypothetical protein
MTEPRTISGRAAISALRPHFRRAIGGTILAIEAEAIAPYVTALREADLLLVELAARNAVLPWDEAARTDLVARADAAHQRVRALFG